jgi:hypothetical protein
VQLQIWLRLFLVTAVATAVVKVAEMLAAHG